MTVWGWRRFLVDYVLGYDFFISYSRKDGGQYPRRLHERLQAEFAIRTFLDSGEEGFLAGDKLAGETRRRVRASSCLLLVARPFALQSTWVRAEIESAVTAGRRLVIVDLNETLMSMPDSHPLKPLLGERIYLSETVLDSDGEPETATLESLARTVRGARREARRLRVISVIALVLVLLLIVTGVLYVSAVRARRQAEWGQRMSESGLLAEHSRANLRAYPQRSLLLAIESIAMLRDGTNDLASYNPVEALQEALLAVGGSRALPCGKRPCWLVSFSPDGKSLATGNEDGTVSFWSLAQPERPRKVWQGRGSPVRALRFSRDGSRLAAARLDGSVALWQVAGQPSEAVVLRGNGGKISAFEFTPDGQHVLTGGSDGKILSWDLAEERFFPLTIGSHGALVGQMALSPDGLWLASGGDDGEVRAWRLGGDGGESSVVAKHGEPVAAVGFSPDGRWLATGGQDGKGFLIPWPPRASRPRIAIDLAPFGVEFVYLSFSPDSRLLATASTLSGIRLWSLGRHVSLGRTFEGARNGNSSPAFSPNGSLLAVGGDDGILRVWFLDLGNSPPRLLRGPEGGIYANSFSSDQRWIATGGEDASARLWSWSGQSAVPQRMYSGPPRTSETAFCAATIVPVHWRQLLLCNPLTLSGGFCRPLGGHTLGLHLSGGSLELG
ncbi:MAG TPA: toll/interleukin-1 receptor domain-containing protein, partial [Thermoanaerobaculia bacterium]|nr:toll/interleukin-1 receptor domain-containing protein [Thermoanaerobaculia bacterium]